MYVFRIRLARLMRDYQYTNLYVMNDTTRCCFCKSFDSYVLLTIGFKSTFCLLIYLFFFWGGDDNYSILHSGPNIFVIELFLSFTLDNKLTTLRSFTEPSCLIACDITGVQFYWKYMYLKFVKLSSICNGKLDWTLKASGN